VQGGSTITQQLVRNLYISREQTVQRKVKEACLAIKLNNAWSKDRILATYMNQVYYGNLAYGIEAAAQTYYSKHAKDLSLSESALLAGLPQAPSDYDPFNQPERATARRDQVLRAMRKAGAITESQLRTALAERDLHLKAGKLYTTIREPYFFSYVRDKLLAEYGASTVRSGGLKVYTTIDPRFQRAAQDAIRRTLYDKTDPAAALISINPGNGAIRAMTAVIPGKKGNQFNLLSQARRQAGSTFKTFVLAAAVEQGIDPDSTTYLSAPFTYRPDPDGSCETNWWCVQTFDHSYRGYTSISSATLRSDNTVYAQLTLDVTPEKVGAMAEKLGVRTPLTVDGAYVPAMGLGAIAVSPLDMASAYATLAAGGIYSEPMAIRRVVLANGKEDTDAGWGVPKRKRVISDGVAYEVTRILEQNVRYGTGTAANIGRPAAGKTGTTDDYADGWFCAYTPTLEATVWVGYPQGEIPMRSVHGISVTGGSFPAQIWRYFMEAAIGNTEPREFPEPREPAEWHSFTRGQYAHSFGSYYDPSPSTTTEAATTTEPPQATEPVTPTTTAKKPPVTTAPPATTAPPPAAASPPPATTVPPPATTEPPPTDTGVQP
jgi:penicillin-binding protein 1A